MSSRATRSSVVGRRLRGRSSLVASVAAVVVALAVAAPPGATAAPDTSGVPHGSKAITAIRGARVAPTFFGMHSSQLASTFPAVPAGSVDLMTDGVYWPQLETSPGHFDFTRLHQLVAQAEANGARPLLILGQTPSFHAAADTTYQGLNTVPDLQAWRVYVWQVVHEFGTRLDYQIWPEPSVKPNWLGTPHQMAQLVVSASRIIHELAPGATVVAPGMVLRLRFERVFMREFFDQRVGGRPVGESVDAVGIDPYPLEDGGPEEALALVQWAQRMLSRRNVTAPLWTVEINYGAHVGSIGYAEHSSFPRQSSLVARTYLLSAGAGVRRVYWLGWSRFQNLNVQMLLEDMVTPSPAAAAYARVAGWLTGQRPRGCYFAATRNLYSCAFVRDGRTSWAYWTTSGRTRVAAPAGARKVQLITGETTSLRRDDLIRVTPLVRWVRH